MSGIARHRTALSRSELSRPVRLALDDGVLPVGTTVLDFGCGLGGDVVRLRERGFDCVGWDPTHKPDGPRRRSDVVNLGYVVNVIESPGERAEALRSAWALTDRVLIVSARLKAELGGSSEPGDAFADGRLTRLQTFQKFYEQQELREWIDRTLDAVSVAAAPGVFYVFRSSEQREAYAVGRVRRSIATPRFSVRERLLSQHQTSFQALAGFLSAHGRLPGPDELPEHDTLVAAAGSLARAFKFLEGASDSGAWDTVRELRKQDLLIYLALSRFGGRPRSSELSERMQRDVKAFCGSYSAACKAADALLFSLGKPGEIDAAARASSVGKLMPTALYVHDSARADLPAVLRLFEGCARAYFGAIEGANVLKLSRSNAKITYLSYPDFEADPHPALRWSVSVDLQTFRTKQRSFDPQGNVPILHRKELFVGPGHPLREKFSRLTRIEEEWGLYEDTSMIGLKNGWADVLRSKGLTLRGHRVVRVSPGAV